MANAPDVQEDLPEVTAEASRREIFNISDFLSLIEGGLTKSNKFKVSISIDNNSTLSSRWSSVLRNMSFFCDSAEFPGRTLTASDIKIHGPTFKSPNISQYSDVTLSILCDSKFNQKFFFEDWMDYINPLPTFFFRYRESYIGTVDITQYNEFGEPLYTVSLREAYPIAINGLSASWADDGFHRLQVTFTYRYWTSTSYD